MSGRPAMLAALIGLALIHTAGPAAAQTTHTVGVVGNSPANYGWSSEELALEAGDTVRWCFDAAAGESPPCAEIDSVHDVQIWRPDLGGEEAAKSPYFDPSMGAEAAYEYTFEEEGEYTFICTLHASTMIGTLTVGDGGGGEDTTPPTTSIQLNGADPADIYDGPVEVTLSASDNAGGSGVASTEYALDGGDFQPYAAPFEVGGEGEHTIEYRSSDVAGNVEPAKEVSFTIDPDGGGDDPAELATTVKPKNKRTKVGRRVAFRVRLANNGDEAASDPKVCVKAPRKRVKLTNGRCWTLAELAGGERRATRFVLKAKRPAAGRRVRVKFVTTAEGMKREVTAARLRVAKRR